MTVMKKLKSLFPNRRHIKKNAKTRINNRNGDFNAKIVLGTKN